MLVINYSDILYCTNPILTAYSTQFLSVFSLTFQMRILQQGHLGVNLFRRVFQRRKENFHKPEQNKVNLHQYRYGKLTTVGENFLTTVEENFMTTVGENFMTTVGENFMTTVGGKFHAFVSRWLNFFFYRSDPELDTIQYMVSTLDRRVTMKSQRPR